MKKLFLAVFLALAMPVAAQTYDPPKDTVAAGVTWNQYSAPQISGTLLYAHQLTDRGMYSFSYVDIFSKSDSEYLVTTALTTGVAQHLRAVGPAQIYIVTTIGIAAGGTNSGGAITAGGCAIIPIGNKGWRLVPSVRVIKATVSEFQAIYGIAIGWGK